MGSVRQVELHVIPLVIIFLKAIAVENIRLNFDSVERNVMELSIKLCTKRKILAGNKLSSNIHVILNGKITRRHVCSLQISSSVRLHLGP